MVSPLSKRKRNTVLLLAGSLVALYGWTGEERTVAADSAGLFEDTDGDFLPDVLEWVMMTDPHNADSDGDGVDDFIEVVQNGFPRVEGPPLAKDYEMRVLVTSSVGESGKSILWAHLLFRSMSGRSAGVQGFMPWVDLAGVRYRLPDLFSNVPVQWRFLEHDTEGTLVLVSAPVAWEEDARRLLPLSFGASALVGGRRIVSSAYYLDDGGRTATLTALAPDRIGVQSLRRGEPEVPSQYSNRLCVLTLQVVGVSPGGQVVLVTNAKCEPAHGLQCGASCEAALESIFILPGGMSTITGG